MNLRSMRIGTRLAGGFALVLALLILVVAISTALVNQNKRALKDGLELANLKGELVSDMKSALLQGGVAMRNMLDISTVDMQKAKVDEQNRLYAEARKRLLGMPLNDAEKAILAELDKIEESIAPQYKVAIAQAQNMNSEGAASVITKYIDPMNLKSVGAIDKLLKMEQAAEKRVIIDSEASDEILMAILLSLTVMAVALGAAISWRITRSITGPLNNAVALAETVASGNLTSSVDDNHVDEIGQLFSALGKMNASLNSIIANVRSTTEIIGSASQQLAADNIDLSARTESQAASLEETASAMEELTATVHQNAENAQQANQLVQSASSVALRGGEVVGEVVQTMTSIKESSRKIVDIISVIDGIAFQTNILALNAAVEAARAGEQGRGFAVVAAEVRNLAQRSASAAKEIKDLIGDSVTKVDVGSELVNQAGATMEEVVSSVKKITDMMSEILAASEEQRSGIEGVNKAVIQMDQATQENAALVSEAATAASTMEERASQLAAAVGVFKTST
ncbi:methyl-accepting chemotaxis protein [Noviherbaspirillum sp. Root189]|uniref:methyl-accepting chemotaxis protein n=1 Tax=Noviherbaspirillum sp. Root189 TaxID=1736487 RepID=UPI00070D1154|nr:methyl-accepting chemotaxis protein [Noviherbaspirillum sp. Root189]KRB67902.1 chemotaxis protein [Noviherbaspirillum sp. Root189]